MEVSKIYLETTMFSFYYGQETTAEYRQYKVDARAVFDLLKTGSMKPIRLRLHVSLNFTHIARPWTDERVRRVNVREGYQGIGIYRPGEVLEL
jgi:hypothetical protein